MKFWRWNRFTQLGEIVKNAQEKASKSLTLHGQLTQFLASSQRKLVKVRESQSLWICLRNCVKDHVVDQPVNSFILFAHVYLQMVALKISV